MGQGLADGGDFFFDHKQSSFSKAGQRASLGKSLAREGMGQRLGLTLDSDLWAVERGRNEDMRRYGVDGERTALGPGRASQDWEMFWSCGSTSLRG